jgi:hypothetical protein
MKIGPLIGAFVIAGLLTQGLSLRSAEALCGGPSVAIRGPIADLYFTPGVTAVKAVNFSYAARAELPTTYCGIVARATIPNVAVQATYNQNEWVVPPDYAGVGPNSIQDVIKNRGFHVKVPSTVPAGTGAIELFMATNEGGSPSDSTVILIGRINLYITSSPTPTQMRVTSSGGDITLDSPRLNGDPNAKVFITALYQSTYNPHPVGVVFNTTNQKWQIRNLDGASMPAGTTFAVRIDGPASDRHTATRENTTAYFTTIDHPVSNRNPYAVVVVTQVGTTNPSNIMVLYQYWPIEKWAIFNQDSANILGSTFNVKIIGQPDDERSRAMISCGQKQFNLNYIDNSAGRLFSSSNLLVTSNYNPFFQYGGYDNNPLGVWWSSFHRTWVVYNEGGATMPDTACFNVWRLTDY